MERNTCHAPALSKRLISQNTRITFSFLPPRRAPYIAFLQFLFVFLLLLFFFWIKIYILQSSATPANLPLLLSSTELTPPSYVLAVTPNSMPSASSPPVTRVSGSVRFASSPLWPDLYEQEGEHLRSYSSRHRLVFILITLLLLAANCFSSSANIFVSSFVSVSLSFSASCFSLFLFGFIGGFCRIPWLLIFYLIAMLVLIILLVCLCVFVYMVTTRGHGNIEPNRAYLEYHLDDFSGFLRRRVRSSIKWDRIRSCLSGTNMCAELNQSYRMAQDFFNAHLSPMQSGCCKPPTQCGYTFVNPTYWISPINTAADMDCLQWSNDQTQLCYQCDSCKAGLLANLRKEWRRANVVLIITVVALIAVYVVGCCAFRNAKTEELFRKYKQGYT